RLFEHENLIFLAEFADQHQDLLARHSAPPSPACLSLAITAAVVNGPHGLFSESGSRDWRRDRECCVRLVPNKKRITRAVVAGRGVRGHTIRTLWRERSNGHIDECAPSRLT